MKNFQYPYQTEKCKSKQNSVSILPETEQQSSKNNQQINKQNPENINEDVYGDIN